MLRHPTFFVPKKSLRNLKILLQVLRDCAYNRGMKNNTNTTTNKTREFIVKIRCDRRIYNESVYTISAEHAWGHQAQLEAQYERDYGYRARVIHVREA